jgi:propanol-preferring alcohol dehydrogenase
MRALEFTRPGLPLQLVQRDQPIPGPGGVLLRVRACGVCRTDLHIVDGELPVLDHPVVPGHEIVGTVEALGAGVAGISVGDRIGVPWLGWTCGKCHYCMSDRENLCDEARFTGYQIDGG